jgi:hypothetical protein
VTPTDIGRGPYDLPPPPEKKPEQK